MHKSITPHVLSLKESHVRLVCYAGTLFFFGFFTHFFSSEEGTGLGFLKPFFLPIALFFHTFAIVLLLTNGYRHRTVIFFKGNILLLLSILYILLSVIWSIDKDETVRRGVALVGTTAFGILIGLTFPLNRLITFLRMNLLIIVSFSFILAIIAPHYGTHIGGEFDGYWRGVLSFKNQMGWVAAIFIVIWTPAYLEKNSRGVIFYLIGLAIGGVLLIKTNSSTGLIVCTLGLLILFIARVFKYLGLLKPILIACGVVVLILIAVFFNQLLDELLNLIGKDLTLTGRTSIWIALLPIIEQHFYLGVGYSAFWPNVGDFLGYSWMSLLNHAHNTYIELMVDLGVVGAVICISFIVNAIRWSYQLMWQHQSYSILVFTIWVVVTVIGMSGKVFFVPNAGVWVMIISLYVSSHFLVSSKINMRGNNG